MTGAASESCEIKYFGVSRVQTSDSATTALAAYILGEVNKL
jgi:hypothetical protein